LLLPLPQISQTCAITNTPVSILISLLF